MTVGTVVVSSDLLSCKLMLFVRPRRPTLCAWRKYVSDWNKKTRAYFEGALHGKNGCETVVEVLEQHVSRMIFLDGIFCSQRGAAQQYHKHNEAVKKRFRDEPMYGHSHPVKSQD